MFLKAIEGQNRVDERLDVLWRAVAIIDGASHDCEIANISTAGALLKLDQCLPEKQQFLLDVQELKEYAAEVVWANQPFYGLRLLVGEDLKLKDHADKVGLVNS